MVYPYVTIDLDKIEHNARTIVGLCHNHGIAVTGVTKGVCGHPGVAKAMLRGGVASIGESRLENVRRLKEAGVDAPCVMLRLPPLSGVSEVVRLTDVSLNSELAVVAGLSSAAHQKGRTHGVVVMVDLGDLREGVWPNDLIPMVREVDRAPRLRLKGLGTNLACFGGVVPTESNMNRLVELVDEIERTVGSKLDWVSGANSSGLELIAAGRMPRQVNHARIGEAILLGRETMFRRPWPGTSQDAFVLHAEVLERKRKPSVPIGERSEDAFGRRPTFKDQGDRVRALLNVGREDVQIDGLAPLSPGVEILGASSGYLVVDVTDASDEIKVGAELAFSLNYGALLAAMTSEYVKKRPIKGGMPMMEDGEAS